MFLMHADALRRAYKTSDLSLQSGRLHQHAVFPPDFEEIGDTCGLQALLRGRAPGASEKKFGLWSFPCSEVSESTFLIDHFR